MARKTNVNQGWLEDKIGDSEFQRYYARESLIEDFLNAVEAIMQTQGVSRTDLARRMKCSQANVTQLFSRTRNLTAASMTDIAFHLGARIQLTVAAITANRLKGSKEAATARRLLRPRTAKC